MIAMGVVFLWILGLASASTGSANSSSTDTTAATVNWSGTFSSSYEEPYEGGVMTQAINLSWTATGAFNYQGQPTQPTTLQVNGTMTETDNSPAAPTLQDNCTAQLSALPSAYYVNNGLMDATVREVPPDTGAVNASADVPAQTATPSDFIQTNGSGDCANFHIYTTPGAKGSNNATEWLLAHGIETASFNEKQQPSFSASYGPYSDDQTVDGSTFTADISDTLTVTTTTTCSIGTDTALAGSEGEPMARAAAGPTKNVVFYSARGSSEVRSGADPNALGKPALALYGILDKWATQSDDVDLYAHGDPYPAEDIKEGMRLDVAEHLWLTTHYKASVEEGVSDGVKALEQIASQEDATGKCWSLVLSGYSQGAEVMRRVMAMLSPNVLAHVAAVVLYGDPYFLPHEADVTAEGDFSGGAMGVRRYDWEQLHNGPAPPPIEVPTFSWCAAHDLVCGFTNSAKRLLLNKSNLAAEEDGHFHYDQDACRAATEVAHRLGLKAGAC